MKQRTLFDFWTPQKCSSPSYKTTLGDSARTTLESHFLRPIPDDERYMKRLADEYELIDKNAFARVFLQVKKILELIEEQGQATGRPIPHIIRGSAGSSLVCYLLGITHIDPILYGIELARFMNRCRTDIPDIDIDVPYNRREELYGRIASTWPNQVARVSNHVKWSAKAAVKEVAKEFIRSTEPTETQNKKLKALRRKATPLDRVIPDKADRTAVQTAAKPLINTFKNYSLHCGGIVVFEEEGEVPKELLLKDLTADGEHMAQLTLNKDQVEDSGFIKIDVLSNRGLAQLADLCPTRPFSEYPRRDYMTERIFAKGLTLGVTFGESRGMRKIFMEMQPQNVKEIAIALALIRPAAAAEGRKQHFLDKWKHLGPTEDDPQGLLRPIVFDDDAILKVKKALGCDAAEADRWRKAFAKGNADARVKFRQRLQEAGHSIHIINTLIDDLNQLVYYSFCKSHALSYAQLVWALAYWKAHNPHAFWVAALNHCHSEYRKWVHFRETRNAGLLLTRETPPFVLGTRYGKPALISQSHPQEQTLLSNEETPQQAIRDFKTLGYWLTNDFLPSCGVWKDPQKRLDGKEKVSFCGVIATGRTIHRDGKVCTLLCIGVENGVFYDIVLGDVARNDLFKWAVVEGKGFLRESHQTSGSIDVETIRGRSTKSLLRDT
jgi:DNA polymerase III alpha subunit